MDSKNKSFEDRLRELRDSGALTEREYQSELLKITARENTRGVVSSEGSTHLNTGRAAEVVEKSQERIIKNALFIGVCLSIFVIVFFVFTANKKSNPETTDSQAVPLDTFASSATTIYTKAKPAEPKLISSLGLPDVDSNESLDSFFRKSDIPVIQPGAVMMSNISSSQDELFASTFEFYPVCKGVLSLTGLLGNVINAKPKIIYNQKNGNYSSVVSNPQPGFSYSISLIDDSLITEQDFSKTIKSVSKSCGWKNKIFTHDSQELLSCTINVAPWISEECLAQKNSSGSKMMFLTEYEVDPNLQWLKSVTQLAESTTTNYKTTTVRKLLRFSGSLHGIVELSIEMSTFRRGETREALQSISEKTFDEFEKTIIELISRNGSGMNLAGVSPTSTLGAVTPPTFSSSSSACANQWNKAHSETLIGSGNDFELRRTIFSCSTVSDWKREASRVGEYSPYLLESLCLLVANPPVSFCY